MVWSKISDNIYIVEIFHWRSEICVIINIKCMYVCLICVMVIVCHKMFTCSIHILCIRIFIYCYTVFLKHTHDHLNSIFHDYIKFTTLMYNIVGMYFRMFQLVIFKYVYITFLMIFSTSRLYFFYIIYTLSMPIYISYMLCR